MKQIDEKHRTNINYGGISDPITVKTYKKALEAYEEKRAAYNAALKKADELGNIEKEGATIMWKIATRVLRSTRNRNVRRYSVE